MREKIAISVIANRANECVILVVTHKLKIKTV
jgi:hypothetical protein